MKNIKEYLDEIRQPLDSTLWRYEKGDYKTDGYDPTDSYVLFHRDYQTSVKAKIELIDLILANIEGGHIKV